MTPTLAELAPPGGWRATPQAHIAPLRLAELPWPLRGLLALAGRFAKKRTGSRHIPDVFLLLMRNRRLFRPWLRFASRLMPYGSIGRRDAELVILRVGWNTRCRYEWGQHVAIGLRAGLHADDIFRVTRGPSAEGWTPQRAALLQATDDLHGEGVISAGTWQRLAAHYAPAQLIEIGFLIGHYQMLAGVLNSVALPLEPQAERLLVEAR